MSCFYVEPFLFSVDQRRRNEKLRTLKLKHLMPSVKQLENSVLGNSCPVSNAVEEESWVCPQHEMCSPKTEIPVQCFGIFHNRLLLHHSNRTVSCIFPAIKKKKMPLTWENLLRPFTKLWRVRPWVGPSAVRICINRIPEPAIILVTMQRDGFFYISCHAPALLCHV